MKALGTFGDSKAYRYAEEEVKAIRPGNMLMDHRDKEQKADSIMKNTMGRRMDFSFSPELPGKAKSAFFFFFLSTSPCICLVQLTVRGHSMQINPSY